MENSIISEEKVVSHINNKLILKKGTKLSDVLSGIPSGIIDKKIPGIGITTLALTSVQPLILVVPTKALGILKAIEHDALYVGSDTIEKSGASNHEIIELTNNPDSKKKIIVVADSLPRLLKQMPESVYEDYFLMIDEADMFQTESDYRKSLEDCVDYYFKFSKRAMVSATIRNFSHPKLQREKKFIIDYEARDKRDINLIVSKEIKEAVRQYVSEKTDTKILIAINHVTSAREIIKLLNESEQIECSILCGDNSRDSAGHYYSSIKDCKLPNRINFMTSAYFTGIDITDKYHSLAVVDVAVSYSLLSLEKLYQIIGRARNGALSETIIFNYYTNKISNTEKDLKAERSQMIEMANHKAKDAEKFYSKFKNKSSIAVFNKMKHAVTNVLYDGEVNLIRENINGEWMPSYFNIDCYYEKQRTSNLLYSTEHGLLNALAKEHNVTITHHNRELKNEEQVKESPIERKINKNAAIISMINKLKGDADIFTLQRETIGEEKKILEQYIKLYYYLKKDVILKKLYELNYDQRDNRMFNYFYQAVVFASQKEDDMFKKNIYHLFKQGNCYSSGEIFKKLQNLYKQTKFERKLNSEKDAVAHLNTYFKTRRVETKVANKRITIYKIEGINPYDLIIRKGYSYSNPV